MIIFIMCLVSEMKSKISPIFILVVMILIGITIAGTMPFYPSLNPYTGSLQIISPTNESGFLYYDSQGYIRINWSSLNYVLDHNALNNILGVDVSETTETIPLNETEQTNTTTIFGDYRVY